MTPTKSLPQREKELQRLLATPGGRETLDELAACYCAADGRIRPEGASIVTYILVHERQRGLIA
ncbi:MAG TPA: hypothetical protein VMS17_13870 [Gemmataceae bacterium]|nr:hypothetical protein [Gemmataceae bacterium]